MYRQPAAPGLMLSQQPDDPARTASFNGLSPITSSSLQSQSFLQQQQPLQSLQQSLQQPLLHQQQPLHHQQQQFQQHQFNSYAHFINPQQQQRQQQTQPQQQLHAHALQFATNGAPHPQQQQSHQQQQSQPFFAVSPPSPVPPQNPRQALHGGVAGSIAGTPASSDSPTNVIAAAAGLSLPHFGSAPSALSNVKHAGPAALSALDAGMLSLSTFGADIKDDDFMDSPGFALHAPGDFDMVSHLTNIAVRPVSGISAPRNPYPHQPGSVNGGAQATPRPNSIDSQIMSPLSASPLEPIDHGEMLFHAAMAIPRLEPGSAPSSITASSFIGSAVQNQHATHPFYSMSMPVNAATAAGFGHIEPTKFMGSHPSSFGSFGHPGGSNSLLSNASLEDHDPNSKQLSIDEKRRRRRESHNAVERRRRDNINEKIQELSNLLPEFAGDAQNKPNKGVILRRSVDYIKHMQLFAAKQMERTSELEQVLKRLITENGIPEANLGLSLPLGTPIELPAMVLSQPHPDDFEQDIL